MQTYRVFNDNNVLTKLTDADLDRAAREDGPLATEYANAVAKAKRRDLIGRLHASLGAGSRLQRLAAATALLALEDETASSVLVRLADNDADAITANLFRAIAVRLRGVAALQAALDEDDAEICNMIATLYNSELQLSAADLALIASLLGAYLDQKREWIRALSRDDWRTDVYILVKRVCAALHEQSAVIEPHLRSELEQVLARIAGSQADRETKALAKRALPGSS